MLFALVALAPSPRAQAASFSDLWQRADQQAAAALAAGDAKRAAELAPTPEWRGGASYRGGDFAAAENAYAKAVGADGAYNRGNALAKLGRYEEAIAAYDDALKREPGMADAEANRKAVEDFMRQRKQQDPQQGQQQPQDGQDPSQRQDGSQQQGASKPEDGAQKPQDGKDQSADDAQKQGERQNDRDTKDGEQGAQQAQADQAKQAGESRQEQAGQAPDEQGAQDSSQHGGQQQDASGANGKAGEGKPDANQQQALKQAVDRALADPRKDAAAGEPARAMREAPEDDATREKRQALDHWLERVPDDPGGLLRRKFQLEYQRRQQRGGDGG